MSERRWGGEERRKREREEEVGERRREVGREGERMEVVDLLCPGRIRDSFREHGR